MGTVYTDSQKRWSLIWLLIGICLLVFPLSSEAATITVSSPSQLKTELEKTTSGDIVKIADNIPVIDIGSNKITISANKTLDLNGSTLKATTGTTYDNSGGLVLTNVSSFTDFTLKNGTVIGGSNVGLEAYTAKAGFMYADSNAYNLTVTVQDITHNSEDHKDAGFFKGHSSDIIFKGKVSLYNSAFNVRALNISMYANPNDPTDSENTNFYGYVDKLGATNPNATGSGGVNLSFDGYSDNSAKAIGRTTKNLEIPKNAKVKLVNKNNYASDLNYANNIGNFAQINVDGELVAEAEGSSLRTTSAYYANNVGTLSDQSEINVNEGSCFSISTLNPKNTYGVIYTYCLDINVNHPEVFDIRNFGTGVFFHAWLRRNNSNFIINDSDIAVWPVESKGIGNPSFLWQNVEYMELLGFQKGDSAAQLRNKMSSRNPDIKENFNINSYSRISNDVELPVVVPYKQTIGNNETLLEGTTNYILPNGDLVNKVSKGAEVTLSVGTQKLTTTTDDNGHWAFPNLDLSNVKGGTKLSLDIKDKDQRTAKTPAIVTVVDKLPPKATAKLVKTQLGHYEFIQAPKDAVLNPSDETSTNLTYGFKDTNDVLQTKASTLGVKELPVNVADEAGNTLEVPSTLLVTDNLNATGLVVGNSIIVDYETWMDLNEAERREIIIKEGHVQGWKISANSVTDVTNDPKSLVVSYQQAQWKPKDVINVNLTVGNYTKPITVTLRAKETQLTTRFLDESKRVIKKEEQSKYVTGNTYDIPYPEVVGFKLSKISIDGINYPLTADKIIKFKATADNQVVELSYQPNQYELALQVDQSTTTQSGELAYLLNVKSHLSDTQEMYTDFNLKIPIDKNIETISDSKVKNTSGKEVGVAEIVGSDLIISLTEKVKNSEDIKVSFTAKVKEEAITGDTISMQAAMSATYVVNNEAYEVKQLSNKVDTQILGSLSLISAPTIIDFGDITYQAKDLVSKTPTLDKALVVQDTRDNTTNDWTLNASIVEPLTCNNEVLEGEMVYQTGNNGVVLSDQAQPVYSHHTDEQKIINITDSWKQTNNGLRLKFKATDKMNEGTYTGKIRWTLVSGPP